MRDQVLHAEAAAPAPPQAAQPAAAGSADDAAGGARPASASVRSQDGLRLKLNLGAKARGGSTGAPPAAPGGLPLSDAREQRAQEPSAPPASQAAAGLHPGTVPDGAGSGPAPAALGTQAGKRAGTIGEAAGGAAPAAKRPRLGEPSASEVAKGGGQLQLFCHGCDACAGIAVIFACVPPASVLTLRHWQGLTCTAGLRRCLRQTATRPCCACRWMLPGAACRCACLWVVLHMIGHSQNYVQGASHIVATRLQAARDDLDAVVQKAQPLLAAAQGALLQSGVRPCMLQYHAGKLLAASAR